VSYVHYLQTFRKLIVCLTPNSIQIYIGCRSLEKADAAIDDIRKVNSKADITSLQLDLSSFKSVRQFASQVIEREAMIDILINNAGIYQCPEWKTVDGFEMQFGTNHLGIYYNIFIEMIYFLYLIF